MTTTQPRPWDRYKGEKDWKDLIPGFAGGLDDEQLQRIQTALVNDDSLSFWWGYRPSTKRRTEASIRKVAMMGSDEVRYVNARLVRESVVRRANGDNKSAAPRVTYPSKLPPAPRGRPRKTSWETELRTLANQGWGCKRIASKLRADGVVISHMTIARRLAELSRS
jgi:hypothetical protein